LSSEVIAPRGTLGGAPGAVAAASAGAQPLSRPWIGPRRKRRLGLLRRALALFEDGRALAVPVLTIGVPDLAGYDALLAAGGVS
jgi:hypothetical protein